MKSSESAGPRIVIIEDNPSDVFLLQHALSALRADCELEILADGEKALTFVQEHRNGLRTDPCAIVLDLHLPKYDGKAVLHAIRTEPILDHINVIVLTGTVSAEEERELRAMGVCLYVQKPVSLAEIRTLAEDILMICEDGSSRVLEEQGA
jgi:CheY-like chemotaxis protein